MKSTEGDHWIVLDQIRAFAAFLVFFWHFSHANNGVPVPFTYTPNIFLFSVLDEGNTGVALFMTLSGYLFAKILYNREIKYLPFFFNRALRLLPLLILVLVIHSLYVVFFSDIEFLNYLRDVALGLIFPTLPRGGWSITVEFHFYLILPLLIKISRNNIYGLPIFVVGAVVTRLVILYFTGDITDLAYLTIFGRIDQFILGMIFFRYSDLFKNGHVKFFTATFIFLYFYHIYNALGGLNGLPSDLNWLWVIIPTIEGLAYGLLVAYCDRSFSPKLSGLSKYITYIGMYSYSIYLMHTFFVRYMALLVDKYIMDIENFYLALIWSLIGFAMTLPLAYLTYRFVEAPFLKLRRPYVVNGHQVL